LLDLGESVRGKWGGGRGGDDYIGSEVAKLFVEFGVEVGV
jgi:hypothetical protein